MVKSDKSASYYTVLVCVWILTLFCVAVLLWRPEIAYGLYTIHIGSTGFAFDLVTFAPYLLSLLFLLILSFRFIKRTSAALLLSISCLGVINLAFSFFLNYGYTTYPSLDALEPTNDPQVLTWSFRIIRALVLLVIISATYRYRLIKAG